MITVSTRPRTPVRPTDSARKGILYMVIGCAVLTMNDAVMKLMSAELPLGELLFTRAAFGTLFLCVFLAWRRETGKLRVRNWRGQALRATCVVTGSYLFVGGLRFLPLADTLAITFAGPLFVTAMAPFLLGEQVGWRRWLAVGIGFAGVLIITRPTGEGFHWLVLLPLGAALAGALRDIITRHICMTESSISILFVGAAATCLGGLATLPLGWAMPHVADLGFLAFAGLLQIGAHFLVIEAFRYTQAASVVPFKYSTLVWGVLFGFLIWGDLPTLGVVLGTLIILGSSLYIFHRESVRGMDRKERKVSPNPPR